VQTENSTNNSTVWTIVAVCAVILGLGLLSYAAYDVVFQQQKTYRVHVTQDKKKSQGEIVPSVTHNSQWRNIGIV